MDNTIMLYYIDLPYACYGIIVQDNVVIKAPPIARWMIGKQYSTDIRGWLMHKGAEVSECD